MRKGKKHDEQSYNELFTDEELKAALKQQEKYNIMIRHMKSSDDKKLLPETMK